MKSQEIGAGRRPDDGPTRGTDLLIEKLVPGGLGLARMDGEVILLPGVLPGEKVRAELRPKSEGVRRARVLEILEKSDLRREYDCPLAGRCGGCDFIHVDPAAALGLKAEAALGRLAASFGLQPLLLPSPRNERYRSRATLHLAPDNDGRARLGFFDPGRNILEMEDCRLLAPELNALLGPLRDWAREIKELPSGREIEISLLKDAAGPETAVCFSPPPQTGRSQSRPQLPEKLISAAAGLPSFLNSCGLNDTSVYLRSPGSAPSRIGGSRSAFLTAAFWPQWGLSLKVRPGGFTQVNPEVNRLLVESILKEAAELTGRPKTALDLYAGLGNISIPLAKSGFQVTAVEQSAEGAEAAAHNARGLENCAIIRRPSEKAVADLAKAGRTFRLIILDPPRSGARDLAPTLGRLGAETVIYVACHPAVLERDVPAFISLGYRLERLTAFDMFPRTSHLETLALLRRA